MVLVLDSYTILYPIAHDECRLFQSYCTWVCILTYLMHILVPDMYTKLYLISFQILNLSFTCILGMPPHGYDSIRHFASVTMVSVSSSQKQTNPRHFQMLERSIWKSCLSKRRKQTKTMVKKRKRIGDFVCTWYIYIMWKKLILGRT